MDRINTQMILDFIQDNGLTKKAFCEQCNISSSTLDRMLKGKIFRLRTFFRVADYMDKNLHEFFYK